MGRACLLRRRPAGPALPGGRLCDGRRPRRYMATLWFRRLSDRDGVVDDGRRRAKRALGATLGPFDRLANVVNNHGEKLAVFAFGHDTDQRLGAGFSSDDPAVLAEP